MRSKSLDFQYWHFFLHQYAEIVRQGNEQMANDLHIIADLIRWGNLLIPCSECGGHLSPYERVYAKSPDYCAGYRAVWRCERCGEMEVR